MKIIVTGGAGFIGSHVVESYLKADHQVVVVDNLKTGRMAHVPEGVRVHVVDITGREMDTVLELERPDVLCHHAAQTSVSVSARNPEVDAYINCCGLLNVLNSCVKHHVRHVIFASSAGTYGAVEQFPTPEDAFPRPESPYGMHKLVGEHYLKFYRRDHGLRSTVLRYGNVYGPRQDPTGEAGVVAIYAAKLLRGETPTIYAFSDQPRGMSRDYVYVEDVARANLLVVERGAEGTFNIAAGRGVRTQDLLEEIAAVLWKGSSCRSNLNTAAEEAVIEGARPGDVRDSWLDITRARMILGWEPRTSLADGIARTIAELRKASVADTES